HDRAETGELTPSVGAAARPPNSNIPAVAAPPSSRRDGQFLRSGAFLLQAPLRIPPHSVLGRCPHPLDYHPAVDRPVISLLTDFGLRDPSAAICRGVILAIAPEARLIDISHEVRKYAVRDGALLLWCALPYLPVGIHVAVVDPGVGTERRPVAIRTGRGDVLVGPDNGLLLPPSERVGGIVEARELREPAYRLPQVSSSFHGRDIFAPAAAHLARGVPLASLGPAVDPDSLARLR